METTNRIAFLFSKYTKKESSPEEFEELLVWLASYDEDGAHALSAPLQELWQRARAGQLPSTAGQVNWEQLFENVMNSDAKVVPLHAPAIPRKRWGLRIAAAAVIILLLSAGGYLLLSHRSEPPLAINVQPAQRSAESVLPGGNKAILILADGSRITLDSMQNGVLAQQGNTQVIKAGGQLKYSAGPNGDFAKAPAGYNTVATPRGGQYQLILPDGSKVWLNAASSIRYPTAFTGNERQVEITGEAYFEVATLASPGTGKKVPFIVQANNMKVQVLGTHFNIMAYDDESSIQTTLLEGSVKITQGAASSLLVPGKQAQVDRTNGHITVSDANVNMVVAWKDGYFYFDKADVKAVMRQVARWYDLDIAYEGKLSDDLFAGKIERRLPLSGILHLLEQGTIHYRIQGKTLTVIQ